MTTDPIADYLTQLRNAQMAHKEVVAIPASKMKIALTHILKQEGFVRNYKCVRDNKQGLIKIALKYSDEGKPVITEIERKSRSSRRVYVRSDKIPYVKNGFGIAILSTSRGVMTDRDARQAKIGGEYVCSIF